MRRMQSVLQALAVLIMFAAATVVAQTSSEATQQNPSEMESQTPSATPQPMRGQTAAQTGMPQLMDVFKVTVKPDKMAEFMTLARKIADANRTNNGDQWIAWGTEYGEPNVIYFMSARKDFADVEKGMENFRSALARAYGQEAGHKMWQQVEACLESSRSEIRRIRWDLSSGMNSPAEAEQIIGGSRWGWVTEVHVRPGQMSRVEELARMTKTAEERANPGYARIIEQSIAGENGEVLFVITPEPTMAAFDTMPSLRRALGEQDYQRFETGVRESVLSAESHITRPLPDISNTPPQIAAVAPTFWTPRPEVAAAGRRAPRARRPAGQPAEARR